MERGTEMSSGQCKEASQLNRVTRVRMEAKTAAKFIRPGEVLSEEFPALNVIKMIQFYK